MSESGQPLQRLEVQRRDLVVPQVENLKQFEVPELPLSHVLDGIALEVQPGQGLREPAKLRNSMREDATTINHHSEPPRQQAAATSIQLHLFSRQETSCMI